MMAIVERVSAYEKTNLLYLTLTRAQFPWDGRFHCCQIRSKNTTRKLIRDRKCLMLKQHYAFCCRHNVCFFPINLKQSVTLLKRSITYSLNVLLLVKNTLSASGFTRHGYTCLYNNLDYESMNQSKGE